MKLETIVNVLLVDDRPENLLALEAILHPLGQNLVKASSGEQALKRLLHEEFALILLDVQMPGLDGYETATLIKARERTRHVPIIFLTALHGGEEQTLRGYSAGAVDYMFKPFEPTVLRSKVTVFIDLFRLKRDAEQLVHQALHDPLTGLSNRVLFLDRLELALARIRRRSATVCVYYFDLDGFKHVNDSLGHEAGDRLLVELARRVSHVVRPTDTVARLGGDEFAVLSEGTMDEHDCLRLARRIGAVIAEPFKLGSDEAGVTASIGLALTTVGDSNPDTLVREADTAMYQAKQAGGARQEMYNGDMRRRALRRLEHEHALSRAIERGELRLHYQPIVCTDTERLVGFEALVRWQHPERDLIGPDEFIGLAEETGMIVPLGAWVLRQALAQAAAWRSLPGGDPALTMAVNLSALQAARGDLVSDTATALRESGTDPSLLCLEVTESVDPLQAAAMIGALRELRELGIKLAVDDFGTGFSSLSHLQRFPVDILKVDRSFVSQIHVNLENRSIAGAAVGLAHSLGLTAVGEGVETPEELAVLRELGCEQAQGYLFGRPQEAEAVAARWWPGVLVATTRTLGGP